MNEAKSVHRARR